MTGGRDLLGETPGAPRRRGRPPGSKNRRTADLKGWVEGVAGGTAAQQMAQLSMLTLAEVRRAGGDLAKAEMAKAAGMVAAFDEQAARADADLRSIVRAELASLLDRVELTAKAEAVLRLVEAAVDRMQAPGGRMTIMGALELMREDRRALLPYTDQRQAQKVDVKADGFVPAVVMMGVVTAPIEQNQGVIEGEAFTVSPPKSHDLLEGER